MIIKEESNIIYAILYHGDPFYAQSKGKALPFCWVVANGPKNLRMNHPGAKDLKPTRLAANPAPLPFTYYTTYVHLKAWFSKRKIAWTKPYLCILPKDVLGKVGKDPFKV